MNTHGQGLGRISWYSLQLLICFIFSNFNSSVSGVRVVLLFGNGLITSFRIDILQASLILAYHLITIRTSMNELIENRCRKVKKPSQRISLTADVRYTVVRYNNQIIVRMTWQRTYRNSSIRSTGSKDTENVLKRNASDRDDQINAVVSFMGRFYYVGRL